jgi:hypothetical protein
MSHTIEYLRGRCVFLLIEEEEHHMSWKEHILDYRIILSFNVRRGNLQICGIGVEVEVETESELQVLYNAITFHKDNKNLLPFNTSVSRNRHTHPVRKVKTKDLRKELIQKKTSRKSRKCWQNSMLKDTGAI